MAKRPAALTILALSDLLIGVTVLTWVWIEWGHRYVHWCPPEPQLGTVTFLVLVVLVAAAHLCSAAGLLRMRRWGWRLQVAATLAAALFLPYAWIPFSAWLPGAVASLLYLRRHAVRSLFDDGSAAPDPRAARLHWLWRAVVGVSLAAFVLIPLPAVLLGVLEAVGLFRVDYSPNWSAAIGDTRAVLSAEAAYAAANGGYFDSLTCLNNPSRCIPGYSTTAATFIDSNIARAGTKQGYLRVFVPGPAASTGLSRSSIRSFAYTSVPADPGRPGTCSLCGDSTGEVCYRPGGRPPNAIGGVCDRRDCEPLLSSSRRD
jgi:hypothetical protein